MFGAFLKKIVPLAPATRVAALVSELDRLFARDPSLIDWLRAVDAAREKLAGPLRESLKSDIAAKAVAVKILNLLVAKFHLRARSKRLYSKPFGLIVDPSNGCNLACPGCVHSVQAKALKVFDWGKGMLSEERFEALLRQYGTYAVQIMFCNYGEPTANLRTPRLIEMANSYLMQTAMSTNLTVPRFDADAYVESGLDFMILSIDGATQGVYESFRRNGCIDTVYGNIRKLVEAKMRLGKRTPILRWQYLAFEHNEHEIPLAMRRANALGVDQFSVVRPFDVSWDSPDMRIAKVEPACHELNLGSGIALAKSFTAKIAKADGHNIEREFERGWAARAVDDGEKKPGHTCGWLYKNMVMDANGRILSCCGAPAPERHLAFANFPEDTDCFNSQTHLRARGHFADGPLAAPGGGERDPHCTQCEWDHSHTQVGPKEVALCLQAAGLPEETISMLANW